MGHVNQVDGSSIPRKVRTKFFAGGEPPASTMVEVPRFAHSDILIEIDAIVAM